MTTHNIPAGIVNAIDELFRIRREISMRKTEEERYAEVIKDFMSKHSLDAIQTTKVTADFSKKEKKVVDPDKFYDALEADWNKFINCVSVRLDPNKKDGSHGAREYLGEEAIAKISRIVPVPTLSLKALQVEKELPALPVLPLTNEAPPTPARRGRPPKKASA